jgi:hypothetical protein
MPHKCKTENCNKSPSFNLPNIKTPHYCSLHKTNEMINVKSPKCVECSKTPYFNLPNKKIGLYCDEHKKEDMINIKSKRCELCSKLASFNLPNIKTPKYCSEHKTSECVDVTHKKCLSCSKLPIFNFPDQTAIYCLTHKKENMVDVVHDNCLECHKTPHFNYIDQVKALYCADHKKENMINIISKTCIEEGCNTLPFYNYPDKTNGLYCNLHKLENMIDIKSKKCLIDGCNKRPIYNKINQKLGLYCKDHKTDEMLDVVNKCQVENCTKVGTYSLNKHGKYCINHKTTEMQPTFKTCKSEFCDTYVKNNKYDDYCLFCYIHLFPNNEITTNYKIKEKEVTNFILSYFKEYNYTWIIDKQIYDGCSKRRPDLLLDLGYQIIIIEIDENQHINYNCTCENKRLMEISQDFGYRNIIFIRFNPDQYLNKNNIKINSCWKINSKGKLKLENKNEFMERLIILVNQIEYWINNKTNKIIEIIQLYYDNFE